MVRRDKTAREILKITPGKREDAREILGSKERQRFSLSRSGFLYRHAQVIEEGGGISIPFIDLIPQTRQLGASR